MPGSPPQFLEGAYALSNGYLLSATILSAMLVHVIDGKLGRIIPLAYCVP